MNAVAKYIDMHKYVSSKNIRPNELYTPIPSFFQDEELQKRKERDALVEGYMQLKLSLSSLPLLDDEGQHVEEEAEEKVKIGPEGKTNCVYDDSFRDSNVRRNESAISIQKNFRGYLVRCKLQNQLDEERSFIGMRVSDEVNSQLKQHVEDMCLRTKQSQMEIDTEYREVFSSLKELVKRENGFDIKNKLMNDCIITF